MHRNKDDVIVLVYELHHLVHTSLVVLHPDKTSEYAHTVVDVHDVVADGK